MSVQLAGGTAEARIAFHRGLDAYRRGEFTTATGEFELAASHDTRAAVYAYYWALALRQNGNLNRADQVLAEAVRRESERPVVNYGLLMQRVQGSNRIWLESARQSARPTDVTAR